MALCASPSLTLTPSSSCSINDNSIGDAGARELGEALKTNSTLTEM